MIHQKLRFIYLAVLFCCHYGESAGQKYLFDADSCDASAFPVVKGRIYHRGYKESILRKEKLEIREDGKVVAFEMSPAKNRNILPINKRVLFLIENHYQAKGIDERNFFANVISSGIYNSVLPGDQFMIATFDWQRNGRYIFPAFEKFTDDTAVLRKALRGMISPPALYNRQEGADINSSLDEALKFLSPVTSSLPTAIILFSDDLDNSVGKIMNLDIRNKALQANIPIYAISYAKYSRYNPVMRDEICLPTYGNYFISSKNVIASAAEKLQEFLDGIISDYQGTTFSFSYQTTQEKNGQKIGLDFNVINTQLLDVETVQVPVPKLKERMRRNALSITLIAAGALILIGLLIYYLRRTKSRQNQQEQLISKTRDELVSQSELHEREKAATEAQLKAIQQKEKEKLADETRKEEEQRLVQLMLKRGVFPTLHYSYKDMSGKVDVSSPIFTIGRDKTNSFFIQLDTVSRKHATILFDESGIYKIIDHDSSNGTFVNNEKVGKAVLKSEDIIQIGGINLIFHI